MRSKVRIMVLLPKRKSWRLCYDGVEMAGVLREKLIKGEDEDRETDGLLQGHQRVGGRGRQMAG